MSNALITTDKATAIAAKELKHNLSFVTTIADKSNEFGSIPGAANTSNSVNIPIPAMVIPDGGRGELNFNYSAKDVVEDKYTLTVDSSRRFGIPFGLLEQQLDVTDFANQVRNGAMKNMATFIESDCITDLNKMPHVILAGGSGATFDNVVDLLAIMKEEAAPTNDLTMQMGQRIENSIMKGNYAAFNGDKSTDKAYLRGYIGGIYGGFDMMQNQLVPNHTNGTATDGSFVSATGLTPIGTVTSVPANGAGTLAIESIGTNGTITAGSSLVIVGVDAVDPILKTSRGSKRPFAVATTVTSSAGAATVTLTERFIDGTGTAGSGVVDAGHQNVTALPQVGAIVYMKGEVSTAYRQAGGYTRDTFSRVFQTLEKPIDTPSSVMSEDGITIRTIRSFDHSINKNILQAIAAFGIEAARPAWGGRIWEKIA